jgi:hypothetical protein
MILDFESGFVGSYLHKQFCNKSKNFLNMQKPNASFGHFDFSVYSGLLDLRLRPPDFCFLHWCKEGIW